MKTAQEVGIAIKTLRISKGMTQQQLADKLCVSAQAVSKWENGDSYPDLQQLCAIAELFDVTVDGLIRDRKVGDPVRKVENMVYETMQGDNLSIDIEDVSANSPGLAIRMRLTNTSEAEIRLSSEHFLLVDANGRELGARKRNLTSLDGDVIGQVDVHEIPKFIPPSSTVIANLEFSGTADRVKLWVNIPSSCPNQCFVIMPKLHDSRFDSYIASTTSASEIAYYYNYHYKFDGLDKVHPGNATVPHLRITKEVMDMLTFPMDQAFLHKFENVLDPDIFRDMVAKGTFIDWTFSKKYCQDPILLRKLVKDNFALIESQFVHGMTGILHTQENDAYLDMEIIEFLILLCVKYVKRIHNWLLPYINEQNETRYVEWMKQMDFRIKLDLFKTKMNPDTINGLLVSTELGDFPLHQVLKLKSYFGAAIYQSTLDNLILRYRVETRLDLLPLKEHLSEGAWQEMKRRYMEWIEQGIQ